MSKSSKTTILLLLFVALVVLLRLSPLGSVLTFENLKQHRDSLSLIVREHAAVAALAYILGYAVLTALSVPGAAVLTVAGGYLFGTVAATIYVNIGATTGAALAFLSARYLLGNRLQQRYARELGRLNEELERNGPSYLLTLRFIPLFPFFAVNFLSGLTKVRLRTFVWTTSLGIIPATAVFAFAGRQLGSIDSAEGILSKGTLAALAALGLLALLPVAMKKMRR